MPDNFNIVKHTALLRASMKNCASSVWWTTVDGAEGNELNRKRFLTAMSQLHANLLKLLLTKKHLKISALKARKLRDSLKKLHEDAAGRGQESQSYFGVPLHLQQQATSSLTSNPVPHILEAITSHLLSQASHEGILRKSGNERRANALKDVMEQNNAEIPSDFECSIHDVGCILKRWLRALPEPVIPSILHEVFVKCVELESHHHRTQSLLMACLLLPTFHLNTLKHVAIFLQEISKQETRNKMSSANLAKILAPSLMPCAVKVETNPEVAKKFSDMSTVAVQVLIDHAQLIASLPPELEPLKDSYKILSDDELSDHGEPLVKRKLFTFLKPKHGNHKTIVRSSGSGRGSRKASSTNAVSKIVKRPTPPRIEPDESLQEPAEVKPDVRVTRSASKKRQLSAETVGRIRERRALRAIQNTRSQPSIRSLPVVSGGRRKSVRRAATTCRAEKSAGSPAPQRFQSTKRPDTLKLSENDPLRKPVCDDNKVELRRPATTTISAVSNSRDSVSPSVDKETARKSFLAAMLGSQDSQVEANLSEEVENHYRKTECIPSGIDQVDSIEPGLDRHGALRKPLMPSNRRAPRRETPVSKVTATITVQL
ncbi:rho GTPase-activating protein 22 [Galendromus occidentalis]|uniref:Rho GTPase-activating protein 22 n=1 Tax=Galendromus occidentalis TaxID=34638 RepID=A0AAJ7WGZ9_9ACAR|nr:rho GTPase-activating protein 22 [Galendromus occidentalis]